MFEKEILIEGMMCENCTSRVKKVLSSLEGIYSVEVNLESKKAIIKLNNEVSDRLIKDTIEDIGFTVKEIK